MIQLLVHELLGPNQTNEKQEEYKVKTGDSLVTLVQWNDSFGTSDLPLIATVALRHL